MLSYPDRQEINGAVLKLDKRITKPDKAMSDVASGERLWRELVPIAGPARD